VAPPPEKVAGASAKRPSRARKPTAAETGGEEDGNEHEDDTVTETEDDAEGGDVVDMLSPDVHFMKAAMPPSGASKHWWVPSGSVPGKGGIKDANLGGGGTVKVRNKGAKIEGIYAWSRNRRARAAWPTWSSASTWTLRSAVGCRPRGYGRAGSGRGADFRSGR